MTLRDQLIRDEGLRLKPYRDTASHLTIGVGRNLEDKGISLGEAELMLDNDIRESTAAVLARVPCALRLNEARLGALINLAFNLGIGGLLGFTKMLAAVEREDWREASQELLLSAYHGQVGIRAERLARQLELGEWM